MAWKGLHVVLGASGGAGNAIARALAEADLPVRAVNRAGGADLPDQVERRAADIGSLPALSAALEGADVVYMAAQPAYHRWSQEFPEMLAQVVAATAAADAKLVMVDNLYAYGPTAGAMGASSPQAATDRKGMLRAQLADSLLEAHRASRLRVAIGRASDYFGPRAPLSTVTALALEPGAHGKRMRWIGALDMPHALAFLPDIARAYVALGTSEQADGRVWILPHAPAVTGGEFLDLVNRNLPEPAKTGLLSTTMLRFAAPFHPMSKELLDIRYQWTAPFLVDDGAFQEAFGPQQPTPLDQAVADTLAWYREAG